MGTSVFAQRPYNTNKSPMAVDAHDDAELGVAIDTRNYRALLAHSSPSPAATASSDNSGGRDDGYNDNTVIGLPVETRNYRALLTPSNNHQPSPSYGAAQSPVAMGVAVESGNLRPHRGSNQRETETINEDEDAVLGLPINTGNYLAMNNRRDYGSARQRSYSGLAGTNHPNERPSISGRRSTPGYAMAAPSNTNGSNATGRSTGSCFDRRNSAAIVPYKGWLYIQSNTMRTWKRYYAVLSGLDFRYSTEPGRASKGFGMVQSIERWEGKPWGIRLTYTSGNQVEAYCVSELEREEWIDNVNKAVERLQNSTSQSKTSYTLAADQHEGYLFKQDRTKKWILNFFTLRNDGYMQCRDDANTPADAKSSGYVQSVDFAPDVHTNALAIQLVSGETVFVYTETYDDRMLWYAAISALAEANRKVPQSSRSVKSSYVQTALPNHAGWLYKQMGLFKSWKRVYCTLHGLEFGFAKDVNAAVEECGKIKEAKVWEGKQHGLEIRFANGTAWKVYAESYETLKQWRTVIAEVIRHADRYNIKNYLSNRRRRRMRPVFGGWLTTHKGSTRMRRFYVADGNMLGVADDVDNQLQPIGKVDEIGATKDLTNGMLIVFNDGSRLKVSGDSVESAQAWYSCISAGLRPV